MELSVGFFVVASLSVLLTGLSKGGFGGGLAVMAVPLMSLYVAPQLAPAIMMPVLLAMDVLIVWRYRATWRADVILRLLPAALVGLVLGSLTFEFMDANTIKFLIGLLAAFFVIQHLVSRSSRAEPRRPRGPIVFGLGILSGFSSFIAHAGGPPVKGYLLAQRLEKLWFVGTNTMFFFSR